MVPIFSASEAGFCFKQIPLKSFSWTLLVLKHCSTIFQEGSHWGQTTVYWECALCIFNDRCALFLWLEFIIQYEENHWEPEKWKEILRVAGSQFSAPLTLYGHINYQFRVIAVNAIGRSRPSMPSERYKTPPCGRDTCDPWRLAFVTCYHPMFSLSLVHLGLFWSVPLWGFTLR